jgi:hypothetical protein
VDVLPVLCYLIAAFLDRWFQSAGQLPKPVFSGVLAMFLACLVFSTFTQVVGAFSERNVWETAPIPGYLRLWDWQDTQIGRHAQNLWLKLNPPLPSPARPYMRQLKGSIEQIWEDEPNQPIRDQITAAASHYKILHADVRNTGEAPWFGYDTGLRRGRTIIKVRFFDSNQQKIDVTGANFLHIAGTPQPGETVEAIGSIQFPQQPDRYAMTFSLAVEQIANFPNSGRQPNYKLTALVSPPG